MDVATDSLPLETLERVDKVAVDLLEDEEKVTRAEDIIKEAERQQEQREKMDDERRLLKAGGSSVRRYGEGGLDNPAMEVDDELRKRKSGGSFDDPAAGSSYQNQRLNPPSYEVAIKEAVVGIDGRESIQGGGEIEEGNRMKALLCAFVICIGSFVFGLVIGYPSPAMPNMDANHNPFHTTPDQDSWIGSIVTLMALVGGLLGGMYMDAFGRRTALLFTSLPMQIGWIIIIASPNFGCMMAGRAITGLSMGLLSVICPVYISEVSPSSIRGMLGSGHQLFVCIGILFTYCFGYFLSWTWLAVSCEVAVLVMTLCVPFIPESPRWLYQKGQKEAAREALVWIRGANANVDVELHEIEVGILESQEQASWREFSQPQLWKPLLISLGLMVFQQFSGINVIMFYTVTIFAQTGSTMDSNVQSILVGVVGVLGTLVSVAISDRAGRRILLLVSGTIMTATMAGMGAYFYEQNFDPSTAKDISWLPVVCLVFFNFGFDMAFGPIPWLMMSELFPQRAKGRATSLSSAANWLFAFIMTKTWVTMTNSLGIYGGYWLCCGFCALSIPFIVFFVPETKGKTLEEIERFFKGSG